MQVMETIDWGDEDYRLGQWRLGTGVIEARDWIVGI
jgi:hypothetical protein